MPNINKHQIKFLANTLNKKYRREKLSNAKEALTLIAKIGIVSASFIAPGVSYALILFKDKNQHKNWKHFNRRYLNQTLKRLEKQNEIKISTKGNKLFIELTEKGKNKIIKYALEELTIKEPSNWDKTWRLVIFDIPKRKNAVANTLREYLKNWGFYKLQNSVYLHAYPCEKEIDVLRNFLDIKKYVRILKVKEIEVDNVFKDYFNV